MTLVMTKSSVAGSVNLMNSVVIQTGQFPKLEVHSLLLLLWQVHDFHFLLTYHSQHRVMNACIHESSLVPLSRHLLGGAVKIIAYLQIEKTLNNHSPKNERIWKIIGNGPRKFKTRNYSMLSPLGKSAKKIAWRNAFLIYESMKR